MQPSLGAQCARVLRIVPVLLSAALPILAAPAADTLFPVKAAFFDQPIGGQDGAFGARKIGACGHSIKDIGPNPRSFMVTPGMVADTLSYSKVLKKKIPRKGWQECNSGSLENWFVPAQATATACKELPFIQSLDPSGAMRLRYREAQFFPIDSLAPPDQLEGSVEDFARVTGLGPGYEGVGNLTYPMGFSGKHNFNWCMEINAQFKYRGGESFHFAGDDDVWVYLDNKLVIDLGGIHGTESRDTLRLDTLSFIKGRIDETFDFDLYFCERRPAGSSFAMNTTLDLEPVVFQDLDIVLEDRTALNPKEAIKGVTTLCAMPTINAAFCANSATAPTGPFTPATWTVNGTVIAKGKECIEMDPADLPMNKLITLAAKAEGKTAKLSLQVAKTNIPKWVALKGNGRLESLEVPLDNRSDSLEAPVRIDYPFAGARRSDSAYSGSFVQARHSLEVALPPSARGPTARSGLDSGKALFAQTVVGLDVSYEVALVDSITPVLRSASWRPTAQRGDLSLDLLPSETMAAGFAAKADLIFKGKGGRTWTVALSGGKPIGTDPDSLRLPFPARAPFDPRDADSVSLAPGSRDVSGNAARPVFAALPPLGWSTANGEIQRVTLEANPVKGTNFTPVAGPNSLVLVDKAGQAINPTSDNVRLAQAEGPVLDIRSSDRIDRLELWVYSNLGIPVDHATLTFSDTDWDKLVAEAGSDTATARVMWYPAYGGARLGTGVYVIKGLVHTKHVYLQDAAGQWQERRATQKIFGPLLFGYLRH